MSLLALTYIQIRSSMRPGNYPLTVGITAGSIRETGRLLRSVRLGPGLTGGYAALRGTLVKELLQFVIPEKDRVSVTILIGFV